jgi:Uma2 family endonuclease
MGLPARVKKFTPHEYLALERIADYRSAFFQGEIFAMAGGSPRHSLIQTNLTAELRQALKGNPCTAYNSDLRILVNPTGLYTYPDASIVCGPLELADGQKDVVLNPTVLFEVLSDSTEAYDRGQKFGNYRQIESLREYVLVSQNEVLVERYQRNPDNTWTLTESRGVDAQLALNSVGIAISLMEIYDKVDFSNADTEAIQSQAAL